MQSTKSFILTTMFLFLLATVSSTPAQQLPRSGSPPQELKRGESKIKGPTYKNLKPGSPEAVKNQKLAKERQRKMAEFNRRFPQEAQRFMKDLNQKVLAAQNQAFQRQVKQVRAQFDQARATAKGASMSPEKMMEVAKMEVVKMSKEPQPEGRGAGGSTKKMTPIKPQPGRPSFKPGQIDASKALPKMEVTRIFSNIPPIKDNAVKEGQPVVIVGKNFYPLPQVWLEYKGARQGPTEFSKVTAQYKKKLEVKKISGMFANAGIYAKVPLLYGGAKTTYTDVTLVIAGSAQKQKIRKQVDLYRAGPGIQSFRAAPEYGDGKTRHCAVMGGTLAIIGKDFGDKPGKIFLQLSQPVNGKKQINLLPATGNWANDWHNHVINVKIPKEPGNHTYQVANLHVWSNTNRKAFAPISYGPKMVHTMVSGKDMAFISMKRKTVIEEAGSVLKVTHDPACSGAFDSGPEDTDSFFTKRALNKNCKITRVFFQQINPDNPTWDYIKNMMIDATKDPFLGPVKVAAVAIGSAASLFDSSAGKYYARVDKSKNNRVDVSWKTTCAFYAPYKGIPVSYVIGFELYGPEGIVPGSY